MRRIVCEILLAIIAVGLVAQPALAIMDRTCSPEREALERTLSRRSLWLTGLATIGSGVTYGATRENLAKELGDRETGFGVLSITSIVVGGLTMMATGGGCVFKMSPERDLEFGPNEYGESNQRVLWTSLVNSGLNVAMWATTDSVGSRWASGFAALAPLVSYWIYRDHFKTDRTVKGKDLVPEVSLMSDSGGRFFPVATLRVAF